MERVVIVKLAETRHEAFARNDPKKNSFLWNWYENLVCMILLRRYPLEPKEVVVTDSILLKGSRVFFMTFLWMGLKSLSWREEIGGELDDDVLEKCPRKRESLRIKGQPNVVSVCPL